MRIFARVFFSQFVIIPLLLCAPLHAQQKQLWILRAPGEMLEYDPVTFAAKQTVKVPAEAVRSPADVSVNRLGQILFVPSVTLPLSEEDAAASHKIWLWNGHAAASIDQGVERKLEKIGSNDAIIESIPTPYLSTDGTHLFWFANEARRLQREGVDLSTTITWQAWETDLAGRTKEQVASAKLPECRCPTGSCEESCPSGVVWVPSDGIEKFFLMTQFVASQTTPAYKATTRYQQEGAKWDGEMLAEPLQRVLDSNVLGNAIVEAIPDTGCCGWSNQSNDQTLVFANEKKVIAFDEQETYKNPDYDVSFYTSNARLSPQFGFIAMTIVSTAKPNTAIQLSEQGQANPEEFQRIRKALIDLPAIVVKAMKETPQQTAFVPHATLIGWLSEKELLIIENHLLVAYNVETGVRRKSSIKIDDADQAFLR
jgi:hypothetical protein